MPNLKISQLTNGSGALPSDEFVAVRSGANVRIPVSPWVDVRAFGAVGDNSHDDTINIQNAINSLSSTGGVVYFPNGVYKITASIIVKYNGITLLGQGITVNHFGGTREGNGAELQWAGSDGGGPVVDVGPDPASGSRIESSQLVNIAVYCSNQGATPAAAVGVRIRGLWNAEFRNVAVKEASTACWQLTAFASGFTGGHNNIHNSRFYNISAISYSQSGIPFQTTAPASTGGTTLCCFYGSFFYAKDAIAAMDLSTTDDLFFYGACVGISGTAHSLELRGKDVANGYQSSARNVHFYSFFGGSAGGAGIYARAGDGTDPSHANRMYGTSFEDGSIPITAETGAQLLMDDTRGSQRWYGPNVSPGIGLDFSKATFNVAPILLANNIPIKARNAADSGYVDIVSINNLNEIAIPGTMRINDLIISNTKNVQLSQTTGTKFGTNALEKLALWGITPRVQPSSITISNYTPASRTFDRNNFTEAQLADLVCELYSQLKSWGATA